MKFTTVILDFIITIITKRFFPSYLMSYSIPSYSLNYYPDIFGALVRH